MTDLALVDELRALGPEAAEAILADVERELGPAAVAALRYDPRFWLRPKQRVEPPFATIEMFVGERGTGKSHAGRELFTSLLPETERPRIVVCTDAAAVETVYDGESGLTRWTPPWVRCQYRESKGYAGDILYGPHRIVCMSAAAPVGAIGTGYGLTWADDIAAWIEAVGEKAAANCWNHVLKSNRARPGIIIATTTGRAAEFLFRLMDTDENRRLLADIRIHDLGAVENNLANLTARYVNIVRGLRAAGEWEEGGDPTGAFAKIQWADLHVDHPAPLSAIAISIDPAKSSRSTSCEVGLTAEGIDARAVVYGLADRSRRMSADEWPAAAWDLHDEMAARFPGVPIRFVVENNAGGEMPAALLRAEEKIRRARKGKPAVSVAEIREVTSRPRESKVKRASQIVALARGGQVRMLRGLGILEGQLSALTDAAPGNDRADAFVHGARDLAGLGEQDEPPPPGPGAFAGLRVAQRPFAAPAFRGNRV